MGNVVRVFFASRPQPDLSLPTFVDLNPDDLSDVVYVHDKPILELGGLGTFDEHGIIPKLVTRIDGRIVLYYIGWQRRVGVPYSLAIGMAESTDGTNFRRAALGPVLASQGGDHLTTTAPGIVHDDGVYHMFYTAGLDWIEIGGRLEHTYTIRRACSEDGVNWSRDYKNAIEPSDSLECVSNPTVLAFGGRYHMWFCYKGSADFRGGSDSYRIGYASSSDLSTWVREDSKAGIDVSSAGWDSEMIEYPNAIHLGARAVLLYNGNGFGATGFGYAEASL
jgi:hypothetical protein